MADIKPVDFRSINQIFEMESGYVLDFSDKTMGEFFSLVLNIDIDHNDYKVDGTSKAKRLRAFLKVADNSTAVRTLRALWEHREGVRAVTDQPDTVPNARGRLLELVGRLERGQEQYADPAAVRPATIWPVIAKLRGDMTAMQGMLPQPRGYAFERFLKELFDAFGLEAREAFRLVGEQIDGSFQLAGNTYLLEAKWQNERTGADDLHVLNGKLRQKATWARGLFVSYAGFTDVGLQAFGRGNSLVCMEGLDIFQALERQLPIGEVIAQKVRRAAETGDCFVPLRELFR